MLKQFCDSGSIETDIQIAEVSVHCCHDFFTSWKSIPNKELMQFRKEMKISCRQVWRVSRMSKMSQQKYLRRSWINLVVCGLTLSSMNRIIFNNLLHHFILICLPQSDEHIDMPSTSQNAVRWTLPTDCSHFAFTGVYSSFHFHIIDVCFISEFLQVGGKIPIEISFGVRLCIGNEQNNRETETMQKEEIEEIPKSVSKSVREDLGIYV